MFNCLPFTNDLITDAENAHAMRVNARFLELVEAWRVDMGEEPSAYQENRLMDRAHEECA